MIGQKNENIHDGIYIQTLYDFLDRESDTRDTSHIDNILIRIKKKKQNNQSKLDNTKHFYFGCLFPRSPWIAEEIYSTPILSSDEEKTLFKKYNEEKESIVRNCIICCHLKLVLKLSRYYIQPNIDYENILDFEDVFQEGVIGLIEAVDRFDLNKGYRFATYAWWWIRQRILSAIESRYLVRVPINRQELESKAFAQIEELEQALGKIPTASTLAQKIGIRKKEAENFIFIWKLRYEGSQKEIQTSLYSITEIIDDNQVYYLDKENQSVDFAIIFLKNFRNEKLRNFLKEYLDDREFEIISLYFGLYENHEHTLEEIGVRYGVTRERARQILKNALEKLKRRIDPDFYYNQIPFQN